MLEPNLAAQRVAVRVLMPMEQYGFVRLDQPPDFLKHVSFSALQRFFAPGLRAM